MALARGIANLIIADKRADGYIERLAWGHDWSMAEATKTRAVATPLHNAAQELSEWLLDGATTIPELGAAILASSFSFDPMALGSPYWIPETDHWKTVRPTGWEFDWLKHYSADPDSYGSLRSASRWPANPSWGLRFLRSQPAPDAQWVEIAVTLNCLGTVQYQIYLDQAEHAYPSLWRSLDRGQSWDVVDWCNWEEAARWSAGAFGRPEWLSCIYLPDHLVIYLGDMSSPWIYYEPGLQIAEGHARAEITGGHGAIHLAPLEFSSYGAVERRLYLIPPAWLSTHQDTVEHLADEPAGTSVQAGMAADEVGIWPWAELHGDGTRTPVLYQIQARRPAERAAPTATVLFDNLTRPADQGQLIESVEWYCAEDWRGSWFRAKLREGAEYGFSGNEKAQLSVARDDGGEPEYLAQVTGYLEAPRRVRSARTPSESHLDLRARDRFCRLANKGALLLPSFAGWSFRDAWEWLFCEVAGIDPSQLTLDPLAHEWRYPCPANYLSMKYDMMLDVVAVADQLAAAAGRRWGVDRHGLIFTQTIGSIMYDGEPECVLDENTVTDADVLYYVDLEADPFDSRNLVLALGADAQGNDAVAVWRYTDSMSTPASPLFIGDSWGEAIRAPDGGAAAIAAQMHGSQRAARQRRLVWQTDGKPALFPDHYVSVQVAGMGVAPGTVFRITEKWSRIDAQTGEFVSKFMGVA